MELTPVRDITDDIISNITYPHGEDQRSEEAAEGARGAGRSLLLQVGGGGPTGGGDLRGLCVGGA